MLYWTQAVYLRPQALQLASEDCAVRIRSIIKQCDYQQRIKTMYYIIMNPSSQSGQGLRIWKRLESVFLERKIPYRMMESTHSGHVAELAVEITSADSAGDAPVNLLILGGDGTVNEALQGIRDFSSVNIGFIPTGSGNDLARDMKLDRDPVKILESILNENAPREADLGLLTINGSLEATPKREGAKASGRRFFVISSGIGFDAAVCEEALSSRLKDVLNKMKLGKLTYLGIALRQLIFPAYTSFGSAVYAEAEHRVDTLIDNVDFRRVYAEVGGQVAARALAYGYHACGQTRRASILEVVQPTVYRRIIAGDTTPYKVVDCHHGRTHTAYGQRQLVAQPVVKCDIVAPQVQRYIDRAPQSARQPAVGTQARHGKLDIVAFQQRLQAIVVALCGGI